KLLGENEEKSLNRMRNGHNPNSNDNMEIELPLEIERLSMGQEPEQAPEQAPGALIKAAHTPMDVEPTDEALENKWMPDDVVKQFFFDLPFSSIRSGRCVSKQLLRILMSDGFCNYWGKHFLPSTPEAMGMTPQEFIRYWSTPSFKILSDDRYQNITVSAMSADGSIIAGYAFDGANDDRLTTAVQWIKEKIMPLPHLNNGRYASVRSVNHDGSAIVGHADDGANDDRRTAVLWRDGKITSLPFLNNGPYVNAACVNGDGSIIVGNAVDGTNNDIRTAVLWSKEKITPLPFLNNGKDANAICVNGDGSVIVGYANDGADNMKIMVQWSKEKITPLPFLNNGKDATPLNISGDGSIIAGYARDGANHDIPTAVLWVNGAITPLPLLNNGSYASVNSVNHDASVIVGHANDGANNKNTAVLWSNGEIFSIQERLKAEDLNLEGIHLEEAKAISANGLQVIGKSINFNQFFFKAVLPSKYSQ
ncbi:MAG: hypothetical protein ACTHJ4_07925, partial [Candidatus Nucleicultricaceae bacterium]